MNDHPIKRRDFIKTAAVGVVGIAALSSGTALAFASESGSAAGSISGSAAGSSVGSAAGSAAGSASGSAAGSMAGSGSGSGSGAGSAMPSFGGGETDEGIPDSVAMNFTPVTNTMYSSASWRIKPDPIPASAISKTYEADIVVCGTGHGGGTATEELYEEGYTVIALEKQLEDTYMSQGADFGHINSELSASLGGQTDVDPVEYMQNWMLNSANAANPGLAMKFAQNSGDTIDWWYAKANGMSEAKLVFAPANEERPNIVTEVGPFHFYCTSVNFDDANCIKNCADAINASGTDSQWLFGYSAQQLITDDDGNVTGVIAMNVDTEEYIRIDAKAVLLATGGFGGDREMARDLLMDIQYTLQDNDKACFNKMGMDRDGQGIKMAYWIGARMEMNPATNDGRASWQTSSPALVPMLAHPQGIHLDYTGRRFYNEYWGPIETRSRPIFSRSRKLFYCVYDDNLTTYMQYVPASHGCTNPTKEKLQAVRDILDAAYAVKGTGYYDEASQSTWYAGDSIDDVVASLGLEDDRVASNITNSVTSWNACVTAGKDSEFGRDSDFLFPIEQGPFYIEVNQDNIVLGNFLVTNGALYCDADQRVYGKDWRPIPGLFATGNNTGGRFGWDYFSPCYGVSVGMATTLGREAGRSIGQYLNGELV